MKLIVAGWRGARADKHGEAVADGLGLVSEYLGHVRQDSDDVTVLSGDNPISGLDGIVKGQVDGLGWKFESWRESRDERAPGTGTGNYRLMCAEGGTDLVVVFPGPNDTDSMEAIRWAGRYGIPFMGFPLAWPRPGSRR